MPRLPVAHCRYWLLALSALAYTSASLAAPPERPQHESFASARAAEQALIAAIKDGDAVRLQAVFGPGADDLLSSGDAVEDRREAEQFLRAYATRHHQVKDGKDRRILVVGTKDWPLPTPLVRIEGRWQVDGAAGAEELVYRRIGRNELGAIAVCGGLVEAQRDYATRNPEQAPVRTYAAKLVSDAGRRNGLYWEAKAGEVDSPAGPLVAKASADGYDPAERSPYRGYYYRLLTAQGAAAHGGARSYLSGTALTGGFAVVAWPAQYRASGVMTFIVNQDGVVYQRDLGDGTDDAAQTLTAFDPGPGWTAVK